MAEQISQTSKIEQVIGDYRGFIETIIQHTLRVGIDIHEFQIDHIAYRTDSLEMYEQIKGQLNEHGQMVSENVFGGRPISVFALSEELSHKGIAVPKLELMAPKEDNTFPNGLQHLEFFVPSLHEFVKQYPKADFETKDIDRDPFPEVVLKFADRTSIHIKPAE